MAEPDRDARHKCECFGQQQNDAHEHRRPDGHSARERQSSRFRLGNNADFLNNSAEWEVKAIAFGFAWFYRQVLKGHGFIRAASGR